jgi:energy-coupling factor transport system ATP-binding protein
VSQPLLEALDLRFRFAGAQRDVLTIDELRIDPGERVLLAGVSGSGKSTLLKVLCGLWPTPGLGRRQGRILLEGRAIEEQRPFVDGRLGYLAQNPTEQLLSGWVLEEVCLGLRARGLTEEEVEQAAWRALVEQSLSFLGRRPVSQLSGGERQRVVLAALMAPRPQMTLLDEPFAHGDSVALKTLGQFISTAGQGSAGPVEKGAMLVAEHRLERVLPNVDRVLLLDRGRIVFDEPVERALSEAERFREVGLELPWPSRVFVRLERSERPLTPDAAVRALRVDAARKKLLRPRRLRRLEPRAERATLAELEGLSLGFDGETLKGLNLRIRRGDRIALLGANGTGKSTLLAALAGLLQPIRGRCEVRGRPGLVLQQPELGLLCPTVADELRSSLVRRRDPLDERSLAAARAAGLEELLTAAPWSLSRGQRLRLAVHAQLVAGPDLLLLDEPTAAQDHRALEQLLSDLEGAETLVFSTHDVEAARRAANRAWILHDGGIIFDGPVRGLFVHPELCETADITLPPRSELCRALDLPDLDEDQLLEVLA